MGTVTATTATAPSAVRRSLPARAGVALAAAVTGNLVLSQALAAAVDADPDFVGLQVGAVAVASAVGVLLSLGGPLSLLSATPAEQPGVSDAAALALVPLHLLVAVVVAVVLLPRTR